MESNNSHSRRKFIGALATGATAAGLALLPKPLQAKIKTENFDFTLDDLVKGGPELDKIIKDLGGMAHPVGYDVSQAKQDKRYQKYPDIDLGNMGFYLSQVECVEEVT